VRVPKGAAGLGNPRVHPATAFEQLAGGQGTTSTFGRGSGLTRLRVRETQGYPTTSLLVASSLRTNHSSIGPRSTMNRLHD